MLTQELEQKYQHIQDNIGSLKRVIVAFSGGVDSSLVAYIAHQVLDSNALAVTSASTSLKRKDLSLTKDLAASWGLNHEVVITDEITKSAYKENPVTRCFHCKTSLYTLLESLAEEKQFKYVLNGTNVDDLGDHRPGLIAAKNFDVRSPLVEAGMTKQDIRDLASHLGLENAEKPQAACLASRVPYGSHITQEILQQIESAENVLDELGVKQYRVRHHDDVARLEVSESEMSFVFEHADEIQTRIKDCGYRFVALELSGFRSGSLNTGQVNLIHSQ